MQVNPSIHALQEGECRCKFELLWQYGPLKGKKTILGIEHVCLINSGVTVVNLTLEKFLDIVKEKLKVKDNQSELDLGSCTSDPMQKSKPESRHGFSPITNPTSTSQIHRSTTLHKSKKPRQDFCSFMVVYVFLSEHLHYFGINVLWYSKCIVVCLIYAYMETCKSDFPVSASKFSLF